MKFFMLALVLFIASCGKEEKPTRTVERAKDPVCGMWIEKNGALVTDFDHVYYFFCASECVTAFKKEPTKYAHLCDCSKTNHNCKCPHCAGVMEPCDCKN